MTIKPARVERPSRKELGRVLRETHAMSSDWASTFAAIDRADFLPDLMWPFDMATSTSVAVDKATDPDAWYAAADRDDPIVTQWDDGQHAGATPGKVSTSSSSMPSVVYRLLGDLDLDEGMSVLDVGTGTGETAGALTHRTGAKNVVTIEIDRAVSHHARERLHAAGLYPNVVTGDGFKGHNDLRDRTLATCGLRQVPGAWIEQTRPGGLIVAPWGTHYSNVDAVACLTVRGGQASGRFARPVEFMKLRAQRRQRIAHNDYAPPSALADADTSTTDVTEADFVTGRYTAVQFALGLRVRDCAQSIADKRDGARPVWFYGLTDRSWACVMFHDDQIQARVWQSGPRRLWDEVEAAYCWWDTQGRPTHDRFGLTVSLEGQWAWLDEPANSWLL
ncbi:methyltransferase domain-containing protein [Streptomyces noursei]|uniref:methyltransferase domain-containing protein n=1 Tax=Streptomyces noursei TaxID=1971 RepID=UPI00199C1F6D|nr:methyltransferase domain-containing protein [Streptomyces noursei]MCZ1015647.1 class I SAM-dependent methyltransferase [Streptomyces noursei]GGW89726.1 protein-L-isoaspartate O-methyltransferase [Streptomyces noursei]